jgi:hypothetical protein
VQGADLSGKSEEKEEGGAAFVNWVGLTCKEIEESGGAQDKRMGD